MAEGFEDRSEERLDGREMASEPPEDPSRPVLGEGPASRRDFLKQAVVGAGAATKDQVCQMVMSILALREEPQEDASDAMAIAICHLHNRSGHRALAPTAI